MAVTVRHGESADLNRLVEIYNYYVTNTHITFDTTPFLVTDRIQWFNQFTEDGPYRLLVADADGDVLGYATSTRFKAREAYNTSVETTIYLDPAEGGRGTGSLLYGVEPTDFATIATVALVFLLATVAASYLPARRALRVDPVQALRTE